jgi:hypothetical protein
MTGETLEPEVITVKPSLEVRNKDHAGSSRSSDEQPNSISRDQMQDFLSTIMQAISAESEKQTAMQEESQK